MLIRNSHFWSRCSTSNESSGPTEPFVRSQRRGQKNWQRCCACSEFISYFGPRTSNLASLGSTPNKRSEHRNFHSESPVTRSKRTGFCRFLRCFFVLLGRASEFCTQNSALCIAPSSRSSRPSRLRNVFCSTSADPVVQLPFMNVHERS